MWLVEWSDGPSVVFERSERFGSFDEAWERYVGLPGTHKAIGQDSLGDGDGHGRAT